MTKKIDKDSLEQAIESLRVATGLEPGSEVKSEELARMLGLPPLPTRKPGENDAAWGRRCRRHGLTLVSPVEQLRSTLLIAYKRDLRATGRGAYRITEPGKQARVASQDGLREAKRALAKSISRIENVDTTHLSIEQMKERDDILLNTASRLAMMRAPSAQAVLQSCRSKKAKTTEIPGVSLTSGDGEEAR
jgi:hypothetical protein